MQATAFATLFTRSALMLVLLLQGCRCRMSKCPPPRPPKNGHVVYHNSESSYVMYKCAPGYKMRGYRSSLCMLGRWDPEPPECVPVKSYDDNDVRANELEVSTQLAPPPTELPDLVATTPCPFRNKASGSVEVKRRSLPQDQARGLHPDRSCRLPPLTGEGVMVVWRQRPDFLSYACEYGRGSSKHATMQCGSGRWDKQHPHCVDADGNPAVVTSERAEAMNPCEADFGGCDQLCYFNGQRKFCGCTAGYKPNGTECIDIDECKTEKNRCQNICFNTAGSYRCGCPDGFKLDADGTTCVDIDECVTNNGGCMEKCENTVGSFICKCETFGHDLASDGKTCIPYWRGRRDYCEVNNGGCSHTCRSGNGAAICSCPSGFRLSANRKTCRDIDECSLGHKKCSHRCVNYPGSYRCECNAGYLPYDDKGQFCKADVDECQRDNFGCAHKCVNTPGSAYCECLKGYIRGSDGKSCTDIDECAKAEVLKECPGGCVNTEGSYECVKIKTHEDGYYPETEDGGEEGSGYEDTTTFHYDGEVYDVQHTTCQTGFQFTEDGCKDIDECAKWPTPCMYDCENTPGSYRCSCPAGYMLHVDQKHCIDIDECSEGLATCSYQCENTPGSYRCTCPPGYKAHDYNVTECIDIDECEMGQHKCQQMCFNGLGNYRCGCRHGFQLDKDGISCLDIDECATGEARCSEVCVNIEGSYKCECGPGRVPAPLYGGYGRHGGYGQNSGNSGYRRNVHCQDCPVNTYKDDEFGQCEKCPARSHTNGTGKASKRDCICDQGYRGSPGDGVRCEDVDECKEQLLNCSHSCINLEGSAFCSCPFGMRLRPDNLTCDDVNECVENPRVCSQLCTNTFGSYACSCKKGYTLSPSDGFKCIDDDECATGSHGCSHTCVNYDGGYYCQCPKGFRITADLRTCFEVTCPMFIDAANSVTKCEPDIVDSSAVIGTRCHIKCKSGFKLEGASATNCTENATWSNELPTCKALSCPGLEHPENGRVMPERCLQGLENYFKSKCYYQCDQGYVTDGKAVTTCVMNGEGPAKAMEWKHPPATCKKEAAPVRIACPPSATFILPPGQRSMTPNLTQPVTNVDLENVEVFIDGIPSSPEPLEYGDYQVMYQATNPETNSTATCSFRVTIEDKEPPKVLRCPGDVSAISTSLEGVEVTWEEPQFSDNVEVDYVRETKTPGSKFNFGRHAVHYFARDLAGNEAVCKFYVHVTRKECRYPADIEHGSTGCADWLKGVTCEPNCDDGYALPSNVSLFYNCDLDGVWEPRPWIPNCQAYNHTTTKSCLPGSEYFSEFNGATDICVECPPGMYWSQDVGQCFLCEQGFYQDKPGQLSCEPCPASPPDPTLLSPFLEQQCFL
ncbi:uncharacterized protein LOC144129129 isoform X3 [Amblyomma americanum]